MSKNKGLLDSFVAYAEANPDQRFWQALRNWAKVDAVLAVQRRADWEHEHQQPEDTFYWGSSFVDKS